MTLDQWCCNVKWVRDFLHIYLFVTSTTLPRTNTGSVLNARAKIWRDWVRFGWEWGCSGGKIIIFLFCMLLSYLGRSSLIIRKKKCQGPLSTQVSRFIFLRKKPLSGGSFLFLYVSWKTERLRDPRGKQSWGAWIRRTFLSVLLSISFCSATTQNQCNHSGCYWI